MAAHQLRIDAGLVELEHRRVVDDFARLAVDYLVQPHRFGESSADVEKLQAKREAGVRPESMVRAKAQGLKLIVAQLRHCRRQRILRKLKGAAGELAGLTLEPGIVEGLARRRGG